MFGVGQFPGLSGQNELVDEIEARYAQAVQRETQAGLTSALQKKSQVGGVYRHLAALPCGLGVGPL